MGDAPSRTHSSINLPRGRNGGELHIVQPKRALDQRIAGDTHHSYSDQSRFGPGYEIDDLLSPSSGAEQIIRVPQRLVAVGILNDQSWPAGTDDVFRFHEGAKTVRHIRANWNILINARIRKLGPREKKAYGSGSTVKYARIQRYTHL